MLKGHTKIELIDVITGEKTVVEEDNLVTNAVQYLLAFVNKLNRQPSSEIMPIATNALGGLMIFDDVLAEDPDNIGFPSNAQLVGYADRTANTDDTMRGSYNGAESGATQNGFVSVWDFNTSQGNGTIHSLALTSAYAGANPILRQMNHNFAAGIRYTDAYVNMHVMAVRGEYMYFRARASRAIYKGRFAPYSIKVEEYWFGGQELPIEHVADLPSDWQTAWDYYENSDDGNIYYITKTDHITETYNVYGGANATGDAILNITPVKYSDESFDVGETTIVTLENTYLTSRNASRNCMSGGYLFWVSYNLKGIYIINMSNYTDIQLVEVGDEENLSINLLLPTFKGGVVFEFSYKSGNNTYTKSGLLYSSGDMVRCSINGAATVRETKFVMDGKLSCAKNFEGVYYDSNDTVGYRLMPAYLGTINNLSSPVVKLPTQTMKVTYTLNNVQEA